MDGFLKQPIEERRAVFEEAASRLGLPAVSVEKDFWVCWTLGVLFGLEGIGESLIFKGGTSLSKAWKLIERFSEDIDIVIDRERLGFGGEESPEMGSSGKQRKRRLESMKSACIDFVDMEMRPALQAALESRLLESFELEVDPEEAMTLLFSYPSAFDEKSTSYLRRDVKIEMGARSDTWPAEEASVVPYAVEALPAYFEGEDCSVQVKVIAAERTCLDKMMLLHEENLRPVDKRKKERMSRHYYDLFMLIEAGVAKRASSNRELLERVIEHRSFFFKYSWMDYKGFGLDQLRIVPKDEFLAFWRDDYAKMRESMFFGEPPRFEEVVDAVRRFEAELGLGV